MVLIFIRFLVDIVCFLTTQCAHNCWSWSCSSVGVCKSFVVWTGWPHTGFSMLSCVKNVDCVIVLQLLWEQSCLNLAVAKEVDIISYPEFCLPVHSALSASAQLPWPSAQVCWHWCAVQSWGAEVFCVWNCLQDLIAVEETQFTRTVLKFCSWSFCCLQRREALEGEWVGFMLTLV